MTQQDVSTWNECRQNGSKRNYFTHLFVRGISVDKVSVDDMTIDKMFGDEMNVDQVHVNEITLDISL